MYTIKRELTSASEVAGTEGVVRMRDVMRGERAVLSFERISITGVDIRIEEHGREENKQQY